MEKNRQKTRKTILLISFLLFPATFFYLSPYLIIQSTTLGIINGSFLLFVLLFLSSLLLGRAWCGWICPASRVQDFVAHINPRKIYKAKIIKWIIWIPWIISIGLVSFKNGGYHQIDPFFQTTYGFSIGNVFALITYLLVLALIVIPGFAIGKRSFCHHICWIAPFMIIGRKVSNTTKIPSLRLISVAENCTHCNTCAKNCPMSLPVEKMVQSINMEHSDCILCGTCADGCRSKAIGFRFEKW